MATTIGLPTLSIKFQTAATAVTNRSKNGYVGLFVRDDADAGVHVVTSTQMIPAELTAENQAYIERALEGSSRGTPNQVVAVVIGTSTDDTTELEAGLKLLERYSLDYVAPPSDVKEDEKTLLETWVKARRTAYHTEKLVEPKAKSSPDHMGIINFNEDVLKSGVTSYTAAQYASRIAGILAGTPVGASATYTALPELTEVTTRTREEQEAAINAGGLILLHDGQKAKIARAVNSLTTIPEGGKADWSKIKIVEGMDLITHYLRTTIEDEYIGQYANTYDNKCVLIAAVTDFLQTLERQGVLSAGESFCEIDLAAQTAWLQKNGVDVAALNEQELKEHDTGSWLFLRCGGRLVDSMEDFIILFNNL